MVMHLPQFGRSEFYKEEEIGRPDESSEVDIRGIPPKKELRRLPKTVLLKIAIELDPDTVAESYDEGWTKDDILRVIERHIKEAIGRQPIEGWPYIREVTIIGSEVELEGEQPPETSEIKYSKEEPERDVGE